MQKLNDNSRWHQIFAISAILVGILLRIGHLFAIPMDAPFRLGGLYLEFSHQIVLNGFRLPAHIPFYSENGLPFAYPPLAFYLQALFLALFTLPKFLTVNWIPPIITALTVPSFYVLARQIATTRVEALVALVAFALIPNNFSNQIEAAGLSESLGTLVLIWFAFYLFRLFSHQGWKNALLPGVFLALCVLSSPGSAVAAGILAILYALSTVIQSLRSRSMQPLYSCAILALVGILLTAPYWLVVISNHGKGIFLVTLLGQFQDVPGATPYLEKVLTQLFAFHFSGGPFSSLWDSMILLGLIGVLIGAGSYLGIVFILFTLVPREGVWISALAASLLIGKGVTLFILPALQSQSQIFSQKRAKTIGAILLSVFLAAALYNAVSSIVGLVKDQQWALSGETAHELEQFSQVIPENAKVVALGNDAFREWAPQILRREVINTEYGLEWQPHELERVRYLNEMIADAKSMNEILAGTDQFFNLQDVYLVALKNESLTNLIQNTSTQAVVLDVLVDGKAINIFRVVKK